MLISKYRKNPNQGESGTVISSEMQEESRLEAAEAETQKAEITAGHVELLGVSLYGMTRSEAEMALKEAVTWDMNITYEEQKAAVANPMTEQIAGILDDVYAEDAESGAAKDTGEKSGETGSSAVENVKSIVDESSAGENATDAESVSTESTKTIRLDAEKLKSKLQEDITTKTSTWGKKAVNGQLTGRDSATGAWIYSDGTNGAQVNAEKTADLIISKITERSFAADVEAAIDTIAPEMNGAQAKKQYAVLGTYATTTTSNSNRNQNILLATQALDGLIIKPGEEFSFNKTTGNRTLEKGYKPAGAYQNGKFVEEPGGGVCQVSSTLYNALVFAGVNITERHPHSYEPSYVTPGEDAMVSYDGYSGPDLRFTNTGKTAVAIRAVFENKKVTISVIGIPILEDGVKVSMRSEKTGESDPPATVYTEDATLNPGQEVVVTKPTSGSVWKTYLVTTKDGKSTEAYYHTSVYKGKAGTSKRNSSTEKVTEAAETTAETTAGAQTDHTNSGTTPETSAAAEVPETTAAHGSVTAGDNTTAETTAAASTADHEDVVESTTAAVQEAEGSDGPG